MTGRFEPKKAETNYFTVSMLITPEDRQRIDSFFRANKGLKKAHFYTAAIMTAINLHEKTEHEREAIRAGRSQISPSLLEQTQ